MANILPFDKQLMAISALTEGCSIRAVERLTGIHRDTIMRLGARVGEGCARLHDAMMRDLQVALIEFDEIWAFVGKKQRRAGGDREAGDQYTFTALDATCKAIISYRTGKRMAENTQAFVHDVRARVINRPQITSDGFKPYRVAMEEAFGIDVYSPGYVVGVERSRMIGRPRPQHVNTSYVERST